jgi:hypothetical protein
MRDEGRDNKTCDALGVEGKGEIVYALLKGEYSSRRSKK